MWGCVGVWGGVFGFMAVRGVGQDLRDKGRVVCSYVSQSQQETYHTAYICGYIRALCGQVSWEKQEEGCSGPPHTLSL